MIASPPLPRWIIAPALQFRVAWLICTLILMISGVARADTAEKVAEKMQKATVRVVNLKGGRVNSHGSGFIISSQGHVATNRHVIDGAERAVVVYCQGDRVFVRPAELVGVSSTADLAILKVDRIPSTEVVQIATAELVAGQTVMTVGFPGVIDSGSWATFEGVEINGKAGEGRITAPDARGDFVPSVFSGAVAKCMTDSAVFWVLHSAKVSGGNSGGPLVDADGRVCGINTGIYPSSVAGTDYPISIHASELVTLARAHSIPIGVTSSKVSAGAASGLHPLLYIALAAFAVVMFLMVLRKPRMAMVGAVSKLIRSQRHARGQPVRQPIPEPTLPASNDGRLRLRGRALQGTSFDLAFNEADFRRGGGRLVIGRNKDLSQLVLSHDSISRQHATLSWLGGVVHIEDRNSGNGTKINGRKLIVGAPPTPLRPGDKLTLGEVDLIFEAFN